MKKPLNKKTKKKSGKKFSFFKGNLKDWGKAIIIALAVLLFVRIFITRALTVSDSRMEKTILAGDYLYINKLKYGVRIPFTLLSIPFTDLTIPFTNIPSYLEWIQIPYTRLPGFSDISRNDLLVINYPFEEDKPIDCKTVLVKRCIALPGDTIQIFDKKIFINNNILPDDSNTVVFRYRLVTKEGIIPDKSFFDKYEISCFVNVSNRVYDINITPAQCEKLLQDTIFVHDIRLMRLDKAMLSHLFFPSNNNFSWNADYFGPLVIPKKESTAKITLQNLALYKKIIEVFENNKLEIENNKIFINDAETDRYTFKKNYYFVIDDNRDEARDSRYWGFLPEDHIIGSASFVWFSIDLNKSGLSSIRWSRMFKNLN